MRTFTLSLGAIAVMLTGSVHAAPASPSACSLISKDEVAAVVGGKIDVAEPNDAGTTEDGAYSSTCVWKVTGGTALPPKPNAPFGGASFAILNTITWPAGSGMAKKYLEDFRDAAKQNLIDMNPVAVQAGDEALWWGDGVAVRKGDVSFGVSVHVGTDKKAEQAMEEALARKIVVNFDRKEGAVGH
ncbi:MAG: hypothetical protein JWM91_1734 [Rhodospirillales bacterium]|nr:hypothetical protein [Rhodospirillales bacterium]